MRAELDNNSRGLNYGWVIVAAGFVSIALEASIWISGSLMLVPLSRDMGWTRAQTSMGISLFVLGTGLWAPVVGSLVRALGPQRILPLAALLLASGLWLLSTTQSFITFSLVMLLPVSIGTVGIGSLGSYTAIQAWFSSSRGIALGIADSGASMGIALLGPLLIQVIGLAGWRGAYQALAALALLLAPLHVTIQRQAPASASSLAADPHTEAAQHLGLANLARQHAFWLVLASAFTMSAALQMVVIHQTAYLSGRGFDQTVIARALAVFGVIGIAGRIGFGWLTDVIGMRKVYSILVGCVVIGVLALLLAGQSGNVLAAYIYAVFFGATLGVPMVILARHTSEMYGSRVFGAVMGTIVLAGSLGGVLGIAAAGAVFDASGTYLSSFGMAAVAAIVSLLCIANMTRTHSSVTP